jgi:hypothetical protein
MKRLVFFWAIIILATIVGAVLIQYGQTIEPYKDAARAVDLTNADYCLYGDTAERAAQSANWFRERDTLLTLRYPIINSGCAIVVATMAFAVLSFWRRKRTVDEGILWLTPARIWHFFAIGLVILVGTYFGLVCGLILNLKRGMLPWCADSIGIPIFSLGFATLILLPISLFVGWSVGQFFRGLPTSLWQWNRDEPIRSWVATAIFGPLAFFWLWILVDAAPTEDFLIVGPGVFAIYLTLSCRAAILASSDYSAEPSPDT